jgi:hypothetical protein
VCSDVVHVHLTIVHMQVCIKCIQYFSYIIQVILSGVMVIVLAVGPKVHGFKPG